MIRWISNKWIILKHFSWSSQEYLNEVNLGIRQWTLTFYGSQRFQLQLFGVGEWIFACNLEFECLYGTFQSAYHNISSSTSIFMPRSAPKVPEAFCFRIVCPSGFFRLRDTTQVWLHGSSSNLARRSRRTCMTMN